MACHNKLFSLLLALFCTLYSVNAQFPVIEVPISLPPSQAQWPIPSPALPPSVSEPPLPLPPLPTCPPTAIPPSVSEPPLPPVAPLPPPQAPWPIPSTVPPPSSIPEPPLSPYAPLPPPPPLPHVEPLPPSQAPWPVPSTAPPPSSISQPPLPPVAPLPPPHPLPPVAPLPPPPPSGIKGAYWPTSQAQSLPPSTIPTAYFTHVFYAFVLVDPTSFQVLITQYDEQWMANFTTTLHDASPPAKAILSIGGAGEPSEIFSNMVYNSDNRAAFIQSSINIAKNYGFDGLDLDWEFPNNAQDMSNLALLYKEWRAAINAQSLNLLISSAVYFASNFAVIGGMQRSYPGEAITNYVDFVSPMCYDYHGGWDPSTTGAHAALYDKTSNISTSYGISSWKGDQMPSTKIVMGMPVYGRTWQLKDPKQNGIGAPAVGTGPDGGVMIYSAIQQYNTDNNATVVFDNTTVSTYSYAGTSWIGYDDVTSVQYKVNYAKAQGLGGYFFWALGFDSNWDLARAASLAWDSDDC